MTIVLLCWFLAANIGVQPLDKQSAQQNTNAKNPQSSGQPQPSNTIPPSQPPRNEKPTNDQALAKQQTWDWHKAFAPESLSNWVLALVGIGGITAALLTLCSINRQTHTMMRQTAIARVSAEAARLNAQAVIHSERAWILATVIRSGPYQNVRNGEWMWENGSALTSEEIQQNRHHMPQVVGYFLQNYGRSPGWLVSHWSKAVIVNSIEELPNPPNYFSRPCSVISERGNLLFEPDAERRTTITIPIQDLDRVARREQFLYVYGIITYRDVWNGMHESRFCQYWYVPPDGDVNPQAFYAEGPEGYIGQT